MGMMVNSYLSPPLFVNQLTEGFESLWKTWAHRRKVNPNGANNPGKQSNDGRASRQKIDAQVANGSKRHRSNKRASALSRWTQSTAKPPMPPKMDAQAVKQERQRLLNCWWIEVVTNPLASPLPSDYQHHDCIVMQKAYGHSRCGVFHFAYWTPLGQDNHRGPCLSADTCPSSYQYTAVACFLRSTWMFRKTATTLLQAVAL
jgi:hypothetical protein